METDACHAVTALRVCRGARVASRRRVTPTPVGRGARLVAKRPLSPHHPPRDAFPRRRTDRVCRRVSNLDGQRRVRRGPSLRDRVSVYGARERASAARVREPGAPLRGGETPRGPSGPRERHAKWRQKSHDVVRLGRSNLPGKNVIGENAFARARRSVSGLKRPVRHPTRRDETENR